MGGERARNKTGEVCKCASTTKITEEGMTVWHRESKYICHYMLPAK